MYFSFLNVSLFIVTLLLWIHSIMYMYKHRKTKIEREFIIWSFNIVSEKCGQLSLSTVGSTLAWTRHVKPWPNLGLSTVLSKCFVAVGSILGVVGSKCQVPLPSKRLLVKSSVEWVASIWLKGAKLLPASTFWKGCKHVVFEVLQPVTWTFQLGKCQPENTEFEAHFG